MRKFLTESLESQHQQLDPVYGNPDISMEEEAIIVDEANQDADGADRELSEAERIIEVSDALEDMAVVMDSTDEPMTERESALVETAGQFAVAGTDIEPEEIVPAVESFKGMKVSTEDFRSRARQIWEAIMRFLKNIWDKIEGFFYKIVGTIPRLRKTLKALETRIEGVGQMAIKEKKFNVSSTKSLTAGNTQIKTGAGLVEGLKDYAVASEFMFGTYPRGLKAVGDKLAKSIEAFDITKPEDAGGMLLKSVPVALASAAKAPGSTGVSGGSRWPRFTVTRGAPLMGGVSIFTKHLSDSIKTGQVGKLEVLRGSGLVVAATEDKPKAAPATIEFSTLTTGEMARVITECERIVDAVEEYQRGKGSKDVKEVKSKLEAASKKAGSQADKFESGDKDERAAAVHYRGLINFNVSFASWVNPIIPFSKHALTAVRTGIVMIERSIAQYE